MTVADEGGETASELGSLAGLLRRIAATGGRTPAPPIGTVIAQRYTLEEYLGRGGMGTVYAARDAELDELIAIKLLHPELGGDVGYQQRLRAEVRLARRVSHPNVCRVHDIGADKEQLFVTMELVRGNTLRALLRDRTKSAPPLSTIVDVIVQIASALGAAHRAGVLHRDVKPDNVMLDGTRAVLTDFGVASLGQDHDHVIAGTPAYIAPEVLRREPFDHRIDVYSTAVVAYELMTGSRPFPELTLEAATARASMHRLPPSLPATFGTPALRDALDRVFAKALNPDPANRYATMTELAEAIAHAVRATGSAATSTGRRQPGDENGLSSPSIRNMRRTEVRLATALVYRSDALGDTSASEEDLERIVVDAGGMPVSVSGLEITALFGVPRALGDDAERAARAAQALIAHRPGRAGLDTVRVALSLGSNTLVRPEAFESAATLATVAKPGAILASTVTARQLAARFEMSGIDVGRADARRLVGARPPVPRADAATFRPRELAALVALAEDCFANRRPRHGLVRAPAGFGKTQLRDALIARLRERRDIEWLVACAELHGAAGPLALLRAAHPEWYAAAERAGLDDRGAAFAAARRWLEQRAEPRPIGLVLEDVQWADDASRAFVDQLATTLDDVPVLVITFERANEDERPPPGHPAVQVITLGPLDPTTATRLVEALAPGATRDAVAEVVTRAGGHPLFLQELARDLAERGSTVSARVALPETIEAIVQARLDRLDATSRDLITAAAVIGPTFWRDALVDVAGVSESNLDESLADLERRALIAPARAEPSSDAMGERFRFVHGIVRDVAYARVAPRERRAVHGAVAGWLLRRFPGLAVLERTPGELGLDVVSAFAYHLEEAGEPTRAAIAYRIAGARSLAAALYSEAAHALGRAAALSPAVDAALARDLGDAIVQAGTLGEAESWYERARALLPADDHAGHALLWHKLGTVASRRADTARALQCYEAGLALVAPDGKTLAPWALRDPRTAALLYGSYGWLAGYQLGDNQRGLAACERAVELLEGTPYRRELAFALSRLGATYMRASRFRDQLECNRRNLEIGVEIGDLMMQLTARVNLGVVYGVIGELAVAIEHTEVALDLVRRSGARATAGIVESNLAGLYLDAGRLDDAQRCLDDALASHERAGSQNGLAETFGYAARLRAARGDLAGAERWAMKSLALADELGLRLDQAIALRLLAQIRARAGDTAGALAAIGDAAARVAGLDAFEEARTEAARARVLACLGDETAARVARERALAALTGFGARREVAAIHELDAVR